MTDPTSNDNDGTRADRRPRGPDAHGQAAMLLVESLIHGLIARSVITVGDAIEIAGVAIEVMEEVAADPADPPVTMKPLTLLGAIRASLRNDLPVVRDGPWPQQP